MLWLSIHSLMLMLYGVRTSIRLIEQILEIFLFRGDPDKSDYFGNTALHLASAQGHRDVVTFLVNFGANIFAMDIDQRTPQDLAGMNNRDEILRFLDTTTGKLESTDKKKTKGMKEKAKKDAEKRIKVNIFYKLYLLAHQLYD